MSSGYVPNMIGVNSTPVQIPPTKRQRLSLTQSKESFSDGAGNWSQHSVCSNMTISLISEGSMQELQKMKTVKKRAGELTGGQQLQKEEFTEKMVQDFELAV